LNLRSCLVGVGAGAYRTREPTVPTSLPSCHCGMLLLRLQRAVITSSDDRSTQTWTKTTYCSVADLAVERDRRFSGISGDRGRAGIILQTAFTDPFRLTIGNVIEVFFRRHFPRQGFHMSVKRPCWLWFEILNQTKPNYRNKNVFKCAIHVMNRPQLKYGGSYETVW
jgi:hypothetical protein